MALSNARRVGDRDAVICADRRWDWRSLDREIARAAAVLATRGVCKGSRMVLLASNSPEFIIAAHAASRLGAIVVPVNTRLAPPELAYIVADSGAVVVAFGADEAVLAKTTGATSPEVTLLSLGPSAEYQDLLAGGDGTVDEDRATEADDAFILYTSGTTGRPKGCLVDHHRAVWAAMAQIVSLGLRDGDRYVHIAPMYHSGGTTFLNATTLLGGTHILAPKTFDPASVLDIVARDRATWIFGVPTMYQQMLRLDELDSRDVSSWRVGVFGAAPMPAVAVEQLLETFPHVQFFQQCGQTEAGPTGIYSTMAQIRTRPDSSGHIAQPFTESRVVDRDGCDTPVDQVGELLLRGEGVMKGYWNQPEATSTAIRDGWLHTGDLMDVNADGALRLVDRMKDVIITGGRNVYSAEVEQAIAQLPGVTDVAVIGRPEPEWGETVVAYVSVAEGTAVTVESVRAHCRDLIADYKIPREVVFGPVPRNAGGKLQKQLLRSSGGSHIDTGVPVAVARPHPR